MLPEQDLIDEKSLREAVGVYSTIPGEVLALLKRAGLGMKSWDAEEEEPELPRNITALNQDAIKQLYDQFCRWYGELKDRLTLANLQYRAAKKIKACVEAYLILQLRGSGVAAKDREYTVLVHPDYVKWDRQEEFWRAMVEAIEERISTISQGRDRVFREDRSRDNLQPGKRKGVSEDDYLT